MPSCLKKLCKYSGTDHIPLRHVRTGELRHACPVHVRNAIASDQYTPIEVEQ
jgi:hypothetical protein